MTPDHDPSPPTGPPRADAQVHGGDLHRVIGELTDELLSRRNDLGHWRGRLCSSALSTAVAVVAMVLYDRRPTAPSHASWIKNGLDWLANNANADGGWGDTVRSRSNLPTTLLSWSALLAGADYRPLADTVGNAEAWIQEQTGSLEPRAIKAAVEDLYGKDKTFSVPILTLAALTGVLGPEPQAWEGPPALPFELAALPQSMFRFLGLPVVSYALPALIAVGQVRHHRHPSRNPLVRGIRSLARGVTLRRLESVLPESGGFLEAIPLTGFVTLSLVGAGEAEHSVTARCLDFLRASVRDDGSWPIDIDLATWVSTLSIQALGDADRLSLLAPEPRRQLRRWLLDQQYTTRHPFTGADPGGWAWTDLPGGVPDADDTPGALLALAHLGPIDHEAKQAAEAGLTWLLGLQNRDGGIPTFCRGWTRLPFDSSSPDLTAHTLRAIDTWAPHLDPALVRRLHLASKKAVAFLKKEQRNDGSWVPLWFGHEAAPERENKVFGTARVLRALTHDDHRHHGLNLQAARDYLLTAQNDDGGWGGAQGVASSVEETGLALAALAHRTEAPIQTAVDRGARYLIKEWDRDRFKHATPIGYYFANLWYFEDLYPHTFALSGLALVKRARSS